MMSSLEMSGNCSDIITQRVAAHLRQCKHFPMFVLQQSDNGWFSPAVLLDVKRDKPGKSTLSKFGQFLKPRNQGATQQIRFYLLAQIGSSYREEGHTQARVNSTILRCTQRHSFGKFTSTHVFVRQCQCPK